MYVYYMYQKVSCVSIYRADLGHISGDLHLPSLSQRTEEADMADKQLQHTPTHSTQPGECVCVGVCVCVCRCVCVCVCRCV